MANQADEGTIFPASERVQGQQTSRRAYHDFLERMREFPWWQEFREMLDQGWDWRKAVYIAWAASPARDRHPATQGELATEVLGLKNDRTIRKWKEGNPDIEEMIAAMQAAPLLRHRRDIYEALAKSASDPDPKSHADRKLSLEMMGDYRSRGQTDVSLSGAVVGVSLEEWQALAHQRRAAAEETLAAFDEPDEEDA